MANLFRWLKARKKVWFAFLYANLQKKRYREQFVRLKAKNKCTSDVFTGLTALGKVSLIYLEVIM